MLGGNGFVGSHICKEALDRGLSVHSLSRYFQAEICDKSVWFLATTSFQFCNFESIGHIL